MKIFHDLNEKCHTLTGKSMNRWRTNKDNLGLSSRGVRLTLLYIVVGLSFPQKRLPAGRQGDLVEKTGCAPSLRLLRLPSVARIKSGMTI